VLLQAFGMLVFIIGVQGGVRLMFDSSDEGVLAWLPGGWPVQAAADFVLVVIGSAIARYAQQEESAGDA